MLAEHVSVLQPSGRLPSGYLACTAVDSLPVLPRVACPYCCRQFVQRFMPSPGMQDSLPKRCEDDGQCPQQGGVLLARSAEVLLTYLCWTPLGPWFGQCWLCCMGCSQTAHRKAPVEFRGETTCEEAQIYGKNNHRLRAAGATIMFQACVPENFALTLAISIYLAVLHFH